MHAVERKLGVTVVVRGDEETVRAATPAVSYGKHRRFVDVTNTGVPPAHRPLVLHRHVAQLRDGLLSLVDLVHRGLIEYLESLVRFELEPMRCWARWRGSSRCCTTTSRRATRA